MFENLTTSIYITFIHEFIIFRSNQENLLSKIIFIPVGLFHDPGQHLAENLFSSLCFCIEEEEEEEEEEELVLTTSSSRSL